MIRQRGIVNAMFLNLRKPLSTIIRDNSAVAVGEGGAGFGLIKPAPSRGIAIDGDARAADVADGLYRADQNAAAICVGEGFGFGACANHRGDDGLHLIGNTVAVCIIAGGDVLAVGACGGCGDAGDGTVARISGVYDHVVAESVGTG